ncbi:hypothetical protein Pint_24592 [Pistacia integerrima]|uniref:Uncharacterized protein n=1 Tax=Pistacia integerrima TaxID=434235 RepID=A0ACC0YGS9_9ROSI|nr:hypothetical protein Pint_24592 [Pistacia integerrima]
MSSRGTNASSGMGVAEHSKTTYMELQRKKVYRYLIFKIDEKKNEVVVEKTGGPAESYDDFTASLPENDCRYAVYDFDFVTSENCQKSKIFFIAWCVHFSEWVMAVSFRSPSVSRIRAKMLYATTKDRFRRALEGIHYEIQATDPTEMDLEVLREPPEKADQELMADASGCVGLGLLIAMMLLRVYELEIFRIGQTCTEGLIEFRFRLDIFDTKSSIEVEAQLHRLAVSDFIGYN